MRKQKEFKQISVTYNIKKQHHVYALYFDG